MSYSLSNGSSIWAWTGLGLVGKVGARGDDGARSRFCLAVWTEAGRRCNYASVNRRASLYNVGLGVLRLGLKIEVLEILANAWQSSSVWGDHVTCQIT